MIDTFAIFVTHALLAIAWWRLRGRDDLDDDTPPPSADGAPRYGWRGGDT